MTTTGPSLSRAGNGLRWRHHRVPVDRRQQQEEGQLPQPGFATPRTTFLLALASAKDARVVLRKRASRTTPAAAPKKPPYTLIAKERGRFEHVMTPVRAAPSMSCVEARSSLPMRAEQSAARPSAPSEGMDNSNAPAASPAAATGIAGATGGPAPQLGQRPPDRADPAEDQGDRVLHRWRPSVAVPRGAARDRWSTTPARRCCPPLPPIPATKSSTIPRQSSRRRPARRRYRDRGTCPRPRYRCCCIDFFLPTSALDCDHRERRRGP